MELASKYDPQDVEGKWYQYLCYWLLYLTSSQPMSGPWCVWGISIIFSSVGMSLGSAKYDTYAL